MCEVCAVFGVGTHWTDSARVSNLRYPALEIQRHRDERRERFGLLRSLVKPLGLTVGDWDGDAFLLENQEGRSLCVPDLSAFWPAVERLSKTKIDPLSMSFGQEYVQ